MALFTRDIDAEVPRPAAPTSGKVTRKDAAGGSGVSAEAPARGVASQIAAGWERTGTEATRRDGSRNANSNAGAEQGSAVVEFTFLALLLMVPLVYFIVTMGQIQGGAYAVVGAADQAAKVFVSYEDPAEGAIAAEQAAVLTLADFGHEPGQAQVVASCDPGDCRTAGGAVTVTVSLVVDLPFLPLSGLGIHATEVDAAATQVIGRYR